jgi:heme/copper-type cytochrome/quinol oxidase subunit 2
MRLMVLETLAAVAGLAFLVMLRAIALHRAAPSADASLQGSALSEYLWILVPWLMMAVCVLPSVRRIVALG